MAKKNNKKQFITEVIRDGVPNNYNEPDRHRGAPSRMELSMTFAEAITTACDPRKKRFMIDE
jgi:hypothetical protein